MQPNIAVTLLTRGDIDLLIPLCLALYEEDPSDGGMDVGRIQNTCNYLLDHPDQGSIHLAKTDDGTVIGYALAVLFWSNEYGGTICILDELYVLPEFRARGVASTLLRALEEHYAPRCVAIALETMPTNMEAMDFFHRRGFEHDGRIHWMKKLKGMEAVS